jgi:hypothetical protein
MNGTELDAAIEQANRIFSYRYRPGDGAQRNGEPQEVSPPPSRSSRWSASPLDAERRFGQPHAKLFPFIGRKVGTSAGPGTLLQVFAEHVTVLLDSELSKCAVFAPSEIEPVSWEPSA